MLMEQAACTSGRPPLMLTDIFRLYSRQPFFRKHISDNTASTTTSLLQTSPCAELALAAVQFHYLEIIGAS